MAVHVAMTVLYRLDCLICGLDCLIWQVDTVRASWSAVANNNNALLYRLWTDQYLLRAPGYPSPPLFLNPAPCTLHPQPSTLNPQPSTLNPAP